MKIYISGKITGTSDYTERFFTAHQQLRKMGHLVVNPAQIIGLLEDRIKFQLEYDTIMAIDLALLKECDAIYLLRGFEDSPGSRLEHMKAVQYGLKVFYQGDDIREELG